MKTLTLKSIALLGIPLVMALSTAAQEQPKVKINDNESKYKSEDVKIKEQKEESKYKSADLKVKDNENELKVKSDNLKIKDNENELKVKSDNLKIKDNENERKVKGVVRPMHPTTTERTEMKAGETKVMTKEHIQPINTAEPATGISAPNELEEADLPKNAAAVKKPTSRNAVASKHVAQKRSVARKGGAAPKYIVRTKVVKDTVFVPSPPERIVSTQTEYVRDTVLITRVDTVVKTETTNTNSGYRVPAGDFKKVKLKRDKDGEVHMKRKE